MAKKGDDQNEILSLTWDHIKLSKIALYTATAYDKNNQFYCHFVELFFQLYTIDCAYSLRNFTATILLTPCSLLISSAVSFWDDGNPMKSVACNAGASQKLCNL